MLFAGHVTNRIKSTLGKTPKLKLPFLQKMIYLNQVLEVVHVLCTSGLYPQPSIAMERNAPQLYGACQFMLSGDVQFKEAYNTLRDTLEQNKAFVIPEYIKRPIFKASKRGGSPIHIFLLWTFLYSSQQHLNLPPSEGQGHFFVKGNVVSHQLNTKRPLDSVYISNGETTTKVTNLSELRLPDDQLAIVNIYTLSLAVLKTINRPHTGHPEALKRWASYTSFKTAQKNPTLTVLANPKKKETNLNQQRRLQSPKGQAPWLQKLALHDLKQQQQRNVAVRGTRPMSTTVMTTITTTPKMKTTYWMTTNLLQRMNGGRSREKTIL